MDDLILKIRDELNLIEYKILNQSESFFEEFDTKFIVLTFEIENIKDYKESINHEKEISNKLKLYASNIILELL